MASTWRTDDGPLIGRAPEAPHVRSVHVVVKELVESDDVLYIPDGTSTTISTLCSSPRYQDPTFLDVATIHHYGDMDDVLRDLPHVMLWHERRAYQPTTCLGLPWHMPWCIRP